MTSARMTGADFDRIESYPLSWPTGHARTSELSRERARFGDHSMIEATRFVRHEFDLLPKARSLVVSSNVELRLDGNPRSNRRAPDDPGIAVYFVLGGEPHVLACDRWKIAVFITVGPRYPDQRIELYTSFEPSQRFDVRIDSSFKDSLAYSGERAIYVIVDKQTGREYVGISGVGVAELGSHRAGKVQAQDER